MWSLSSFFPHAATTVAFFLSSSMFFRLLRFWLSLTVSPPTFQSVVFLSVLWSYSRFFRILRLRLLFPFAAPPVVFHAAGSSLAVPRLSGSCFPCFLLVFFRLFFSVCFVFLPYPSGCSPLVSVPPSACCGVMRSGFGSFSAVSALLCCCGFWLSVF